MIDMGYGYGWTRNGRQALACDRCGESEGRTRKRTCPRKVLTESLRTSSGKRVQISYCYPPAYCPKCFKEAGGTRVIHKGCAEGAARETAKADAIEAALDAGEKFVVSASGDWKEGVPKGQVEVTFWGRPTEGGPRHGEVRVFVPQEDYDPQAKPKLSDYPEAVAA